MRRFVSLILACVLILVNTMSFGTTLNEVRTSFTLMDSKGVPIPGAFVRYQTSSWHDAGYTDSNGQVFVAVSSQYSALTYRVYYEGANVDVRQNIHNQPNFRVQTVETTIHLVDSKGLPLNGGKLQYQWASWFWMEDMDHGVLKKELLPSTYTFRMHYEDGRQDIKQNISLNPEVYFRTIETKVLLLDPDSKGLSGGKVQYCRASWGTFGDTEDGVASKELLPSQYTFRMKYRDGVMDIKQDISINPNVEFKTKEVSITVMDSDENTLANRKINYSRVSWDTLGYTNEAGLLKTDLLPNTYHFRSFYDWHYVDVTQNLLFDSNVIIVLPKENSGTNDVITEPEEPEVPNEPVADIPLDPNAPNHKVILVTNDEELRKSEALTKEGNMTVWLADGTYHLTRGLYITGDSVTYKSLSGNRDEVVILGDYKAGNGFSAVGDYFTVSDLSIGQVNNHGVQVHAEKDADYAVISNVRFFDIKEQMIKGSGDTSQTFSDYGLVENCLFEFTSGEALQYYTGGIDVHKGKHWIVRNNTFKNIRRSTGALTEGAIHFWSASSDTLIENNTIINCDRGIMLGLDNSPHYDGTIINNFIHVTRDVGIYICNAENSKVYHNTIYVDSDYPNSIEYRFNTPNTKISNNLTNKTIQTRNGGTGTLSSNIINASSSWFVDVPAGDLHLQSLIHVVVNQGEYLNVLTDIDGDKRVEGYIDIGADERPDYDVYSLDHIALEVDRTEILGNGSDQVTLQVIGYDSSGKTVEVDADAYYYLDGNQIVTLKDNTFKSYQSGLYNLYVSVGDLKASLEITVKAIASEDYLPTEVQVIHENGQSFIMFTETQPLLNTDEVTVRDFFNVYWENPNQISYKIYKGVSSATDFNQLTYVGEVKQGSGFNLGFYNIRYDFKDWQLSQYMEEPLKSYVVPESIVLEGNQGLYVVNTTEEDSVCYVVTVVINGTEIKALAHNISNTVHEQIAEPQPVYQYSENKTFQYIKDATLDYYVRWGEDGSYENKSNTYLVAVPPTHLDKAPVGIHLHCWGGTLTNGYGWWNDVEEGALLLASNQDPYDWWTGYFDNYFDKKSFSQIDWSNVIVHPYTSERMISFLEWMNTSDRYQIDMTRTFVAGTSMGGSGSLMMAIRYPEYFAWARSWVGVHVPSLSPNFKSSYELVYGKETSNVSFEDGTPVWDYYNDVWYLKNHISEDIGFLSFSNGKNDAGIGWQQAVLFYEALQETRQPHLFIWGQNGHGERSKFPMNGSERIMPIDIRLDQALPAYTHCSLDDIAGDGNPESGDPSGQVNAYLYWMTDNLVDEVNHFEITSFLMDTAPEVSCTVDITPRRLQNFEIQVGDIVYYQNIDCSSGMILDAGMEKVDAYGLITIPQQIVNKTGTQLKLKVQN
ncbi:MAG: right-handed parallel beta-helix repeat-containing protein [Clostridia bacterium]|nr:right-handed parallel beta-helix repeat-containing protein [Clostridia bacterium]